MTEEIVPREEEHQEPLEGQVEVPRQRQKVFRCVLDLSSWLSLTRPSVILVKTGQDAKGLFYQLTTEG